MSLKKIGIYGGTFDPIHQGHLIIAQFVLDELNLDKIVFVPAAIPPHKEHQKITDANFRWQMVQLAIESNPAFEASSIELDKNGPSYSIKTIQLLREKWHLTRKQLHFIIGADSLLEMHLWYRPDDIFTLSRVVVVPRPNVDLSSVKPGFKQRVLLIDAPLIQISSSDIREMVRAGRSIQYLVPEKVEQFISENRLYLQN